MATYYEKEGITRRQFIKGTGFILVLAALGGATVKLALYKPGSGGGVVQRRFDALYQRDERMPVRKAHENQNVLALYYEYLTPGQIRPLKGKAQTLFRTRYGPDVPRFTQQLQQLKQ